MQQSFIMTCGSLYVIVRKLSKRFFEDPTASYFFSLISHYFISSVFLNFLLSFKCEKHLTIIFHTSTDKTRNTHKKYVFDSLGFDQTMGNIIWCVNRNGIGIKSEWNGNENENIKKIVKIVINWMKIKSIENALIWTKQKTLKLLERIILLSFSFYYLHPQ